MSLYEKIASVIIALLVIGIVIFSFRELTESHNFFGGTGAGSDFDESLGAQFAIGPFDTVVNQRASGGREDNCEALQPVVLGTLHDIKEHLEAQKVPGFTGPEATLEVNQATLEIFCNKNARVTLGDARGDTLVLQKVPFVRSIPPGGSGDDIGTEVHITATLVPLGATVPTEPTAVGDELIPDRFLDSATTSAS